jgi:hypothetical protein
MAALKVPVPSASPQHELRDTANEVTIAKPTERPKAPSYWFPRFQEWLTLDAAEYRSTLAKAAI